MVSSSSFLTHPKHYPGRCVLLGGLTRLLINPRCVVSSARVLRVKISMNIKVKQNYVVCVAHMLRLPQHSCVFFITFGELQFVELQIPNIFLPDNVTFSARNDAIFRMTFEKPRAHRYIGHRYCPRRCFQVPTSVLGTDRSQFPANLPARIMPLCEERCLRLHKIQDRTIVVKILRICENLKLTLSLNKSL